MKTFLEAVATHKETGKKTILIGNKQILGPNCMALALSIVADLTDSYVETHNISITIDDQPF